MIQWGEGFAVVECNCGLLFQAIHADGKRWDEKATCEAAVVHFASCPQARGELLQAMLDTFKLNHWKLPKEVLTA